jgi:peptide/nickel transport system substrate-binding protein
MKKMSYVLAVVVALSMLLAACTPAAAPTAVPTIAIQKFEPTAAPVQPATAAPTEASAAAPEPTMVPEATTPPEKVADPDAKITVALETIIENYDFMTNSTLNSAGIFEMMYDRLVNLDDKVVLQPMLATEWKVSEDGKVWTFKLRNDAKFWDGTPLTAKDVKYTVERMQLPDYNIGNTQYLNSQFLFDKAVVVDDNTIEIHTKSPVPALLYTIEEINILPEHIYSKLTPEEAGSKTIMGSGPFKFVNFTKDDLVTLERNDDYWGPKAQFKTLVYRAIPEPSTRIAELETGGVDVIQGIPMAQADAVNGMANARVEAVSNGCRQYLGFNFANPWYQDKNVRLAINHAIDWESINQAFFKGSAPRMVVHVNKPWLNESLKAYDFDLAKVDELLTASGFKKGADGIYEKDGKKLAPSIMVYYAQTSERYEVLLSLVDQMKKAGIAAEPYYLESSAAFEKLDKRQIDDMFFIGSCTSYEGQGDISDLEKDSGSNYGRWENADFEAMFTDLLKEFDLNKRHEILDKMQVLLYEEAPMVPLWIRVDVWGISKNVDWHPNPSGRALMLSAAKYK